MRYLTLAILLTGSLSTLPLYASVTDSSHSASETIIQVQLNQLLPTQAAIGYDQVYYKLARFAQAPQAVLEEYCETNGQLGLSHASNKASLQDPASFGCQAAVGSDPQSMKTVVIGPQQQLYLTDGHHTFTSLWEHPDAGPELTMHVRVSADFSDSPSLEHFWQRMQQANKVWLRSGTNQAIEPQQLPKQLGLQQLDNDPYRALVYFTRGAAYEKPRSGNTPIEYLEFYWGNWLRPQLDLRQYDLNNLKSYQQAVTAASQLMVKAAADQPITNTGLTPQQLGGYQRLNRKKLNKTLTNKVPLALQARTQATP